MFQARALYAFDAQPGSGELNINENEVLTVLRKDVGDGWYVEPSNNFLSGLHLGLLSRWEGINGRGETGLFPAAYVEEIQV